MNAKQYFKKSNLNFYNVFLNDSMMPARLNQLFKIIEGYADYKAELKRKRDNRNNHKNMIAVIDQTGIQYLPGK